MGIFSRVWRHLPELGGTLLIIAIQVQFGRWLLAATAARRSQALRRLIVALVVLLSGWVAYGFLGGVPHRYFSVPHSPALVWVRGGALAWALASLSAFVLALAWLAVPRFSSSRRGFLKLAAGGFAGAPFAVAGYGMFVERDAFRVREIDVPMPGLPKDLDGLRLVQVSDIHLSPFLSERELARVIDMANELKAHVALVTGDLITSPGDPLEACLRQVSRLKSDAGILGCLGNHEIYAGVQQQATSEGARLGIGFLRRAARPLRFGAATLNVAGVDYQRFGGPYLRGAGRLIDPQATNLLLSHNPDVFDVAAGQGFQLTISGHTHGGQINFEILHKNLNVARFFTPYIYGLYRNGPASIWVTRGIGTVGVPMRLGAPPEVALIRLCAT